MTNHENGHDKDVPTLDLSQEELETQHRALAYALIQIGEVNDNNGTFIPGIDNPAQRFTFELPTNLIRETFFNDDSDMIVKSGSYIEYLAPHQLDEGSGERGEESEDIYLSFGGHLIDTEIDCFQSIHIRLSGTLYTGEFDTQYEKNGKRISPNDLPEGMTTLMELGMSEAEAGLIVAQDYVALERPLTIDDAENLRKIEMYLLRAV